MTVNTNGAAERRRFIRHPLSYPLRTELMQSEKKAQEISGESDNIGAGGLLFKSIECVRKGSEVKVEIEVEGRKFIVEGDVVRCSKEKGGAYSVAVSFVSPQELLRARLMEQVVRIEIFKRRLERRYNVTLDFSCIAKEWIKRYSKVFAKHLHS